MENENCYSRIIYPKILIIYVNSTFRYLSWKNVVNRSILDKNEKDVLKAEAKTITGQYSN